MKFHLGKNEKPKKEKEKKKLFFLTFSINKN